MNPNQIDNEFKVSPVFTANKLAFDNKKFRIICNQGGSRSGKTYSITQLLCIIAALVPNYTISFVSKTLPHLKRGAMRDFKIIMQSLGMWDENRWHGTDRIYTFPNGTIVEFFSADDSEKLRGPGRDILFINEANLLSIDEWRQLNLRTRYKIFIDYNPADEESYIYDIIIPREDCKFIQSCFLDNFDFLPEVQRLEIERLEYEDPAMWQIYGLGNVARATNKIYHNWIESSEIVGNESIWGLDFGFNAPTALIELRPEQRNVSVKQHIYETGLTSSDIIDRLNAIIPNKYDFIYADGARPEIIAEISDAGFNIHKANKGVFEGIDYCKRFKFLIEPLSVDVIKEFKMYKWKEDRNGKVLDEPVKFNDHAMDAIRYALYTYGVKYLSLGDTMVFPKKITTKSKRASVFGGI